MKELAPEYVGRIPAAIRKAADRAGDRIAFVEVVTGIASTRGWGYELATRDGWCFDPATHFEIADNADQAVSAIRRVTECRCADCARGGN